MALIEIENLTKDYGEGRGVFGLNMKINKGEMIGFVGTNGSGKTTAIRSMLGFIKPDGGCVKINGINSWEKQDEVAKFIGYVPGEIAFPDHKTGTDFIKSQAEFFGLKNLDYANELTRQLQLDLSANLKRMSKGMKQKTALVAALMNNAEILILDEPTTGLDPLMRIAFMDIIKKEHKKGKTIFMSSHMFNEVENNCDKVALISNGKIVDFVDLNEIRNRKTKDYKIEFNNRVDYVKFKNKKFNIIRDQEQYNQVTINIDTSNISNLFKELCKFDVRFIIEVPYTLEKHFKSVLNGQKEEGNV